MSEEKIEMLIKHFQDTDVTIAAFSAIVDLASEFKKQKAEIERLNDDIERLNALVAGLQEEKKELIAALARRPSFPQSPFID